MWREREAERAKGEREREEEEGWGSREQHEGSNLGWGWSVHHGPAPTAPGKEHRVNGVEVPDHNPAWTRITLGLSTLLLPLGFPTLQDPAVSLDTPITELIFQP